jgi:nucleoside-diphosphate-sugar epimerase
MDASSGSVIGSMISNALVGADLIIPSDESVGLNVCYVSDVIDAFVKVQSRQDLTWRVFNVAASNNIPYRTLAELIIALTGSRSKITSSFLNYKNKFTIVADISAAKTNLLWQPKIGIEEGLDKTITYFLHKRKSS